jgi:hypothetical protein
MDRDTATQSATPTLPRLGGVLRNSTQWEIGVEIILIRTFLKCLFHRGFTP